MYNFKDLKVWNKSVDLATRIYQVTKTFPKEELFGLVGQMRRASVSIASNLAEGAGRNSNKDFARFISIANGSCCELETQLIISYKTNFISEKELNEINSEIEVIKKMNFKLKQSLKI